MAATHLIFWKKYKLITSTDDMKSQILAKEIRAQECRFCKLNPENTTFSQKTHLLPELLGGNSILTTDECDECNKLFSGFESHLSTFFRPYLVISGVTGKKKIPKFQSRTNNRDESTRTVMSSDDMRRIQINLGLLEDYKLDKEHKTATIKFRKEPYIPLNVYKALLKIGLSLLPLKYIEEYSSSFKLLTKGEPTLSFFSYGYIYTLKRKRFSEPKAELYKAKRMYSKNKVFPEMTLLLYFANQVVQIFLPFPKRFEKIHGEMKRLSISLYPSFAFDDLTILSQIELKSYDLGVKHIVKENLIEHFTYENGEFNIFK